MKSLWEPFAADRIDHADLQHIIQRHFPSGSQPAKGEVTYPGDGPHAVKLRFSKNNRLTHIEAGPGLTPECEAAIVTAINNALTPTEPRVFRHVLFAGHKLNGDWRYGDKFQVTPIPAEAPQLNCLMGDHPLILETKMKGTNDALMTSRKAGRALREQKLLLAGLVNSGIHELETRSVYGYWINLPGEGYKTAYLMPGYHYKPSLLTEDFTPITNPAPETPSSTLFAPYSMPAGAPFTFPDDLCTTLDAYYRLSAGSQQRFLRSCYWLQYANQAFFHSCSAAFMAVVTAAEVLFPPGPAEKCPTCDQPRYRLRSAFAQLLERSFGALTGHRVEEHGSIEARLKNLYDTRSNITHGTGLHAWDESNEFTPRSCQDDDDLRTLLRILPHTLALWIKEHF